MDILFGSLFDSSIIVSLRVMCLCVCVFVFMTMGLSACQSLGLFVSVCLSLFMFVWPTVRLLVSLLRVSLHVCVYLSVPKFASRLAPALIHSLSKAQPRSGG
jgi:hypothetical protein